MRPSLIAFLLATASTAACAHASTGVSCPVDITASQLNSGKTVWAISDEDAKLSKQSGAYSDGIGVHVSLQALRKNKIKQVSLRVYFAQPGLHYLPTTPPSNAPSIDKTANLKKTFHLAAADGASEQLTGDLLVGQTAGIKRVAVTSIVFTSGYTWQDWSGSACSVEPNHFMPVQVK